MARLVWPSTGRPIPRLVIATAVAAVVGGGLLILVAVTGSAGRSRPAARASAPVSVSPHTTRGATAAALSIGSELGDGLLTEPTGRLAALYVPAQRAGRQAQLEHAAAIIRDKNGDDAVIRAVPVGYHLDSYRADRAVVTVWSAAIAGGSKTGPFVTWGSSTMTLVWTAGGWLLTDSNDVEGPTPSPAQMPSDPQALIANLRLMEVIHADS